VIDLIAENGGWRLDRGGSQSSNRKLQNEANLLEMQKLRGNRGSTTEGIRHRKIFLMRDRC
jgi:hypothetical protein